MSVLEIVHAEDKAGHQALIGHDDIRTTYATAQVAKLAELIDGNASEYGLFHFLGHGDPDRRTVRLGSTDLGAEFFMQRSKQGAFDHRPMVVLTACLPDEGDEAKENGPSKRSWPERLGRDRGRHPDLVAALRDAGAGSVLVADALIGRQFGLRTSNQIIEEYRSLGRLVGVDRLREMRGEGLRDERSIGLLAFTYHQYAMPPQTPSLSGLIDRERVVQRDVIYFS